MLICNRVNTAMHSCIYITEIQGMIFGLLDLHDCTQLARTCRSFYDQATDIVWGHITSLIPFIRCMPTEILTYAVTQPSPTPTFHQVEIVSFDSPLQQLVL